MKRTEIRAHSPLYSVNTGRVASKNAGAASIAVAIPVLIACFASCSFNLSVMAHIDCPIRPKNDKSFRAGV